MPTAKKMCFDRILPAELNRPQRTRMVGGRQPAISPVGKQWINGSALRIRFMQGTQAQKDMVRDIAPEWTRHANLDFEFTDDPRAEIRVTFDAERRRLVLCRHRQFQHPAARGHPQPRLAGRGRDPARVRPHDRARARAPEPGRRHHLERGQGDRRPLGPAQLLGRADDPAQRAEQIQRRPGARHRPSTSCR